MKPNLLVLAALINTQLDKTHGKKSWGADEVIKLLIELGAIPAEAFDLGNPEVIL